MITNPANALVRVAMKKAGSPVGTGFIFHQEPDGILILTCREIVDPQEPASPSSDESQPPKVLIDGLYEAEWVFGLGNTDSDLAVLKCTAVELSRREPLHLGQPLSFGNTSIVYDKNLPVGPKNLIRSYYKLERSDGKTELVLRNDPDNRIQDIHSGSPVIDENWAVGVVIGAASMADGAAGNDNDLIIAAPVEQLVYQWREGRNLIASPLPPGLVQELSRPIQQFAPLYARFLVAVSEPTDDGNLNDELAIIQETISRRLPPSSEVELWLWESSQSMRRLPESALAADVQQVPSFSEFDVVIVIGWHNLGPRAYGLDELERDTRELTRLGKERLIYRKNESSPDDVEAFFEQLTLTHKVAYRNYKGEGFAECFGEDFQRLIGKLAGTQSRRTARIPAAPAKLNPYRGLKSYLTAHARLFNGRSRETTHLRNRLANQPNGFLVVAGASGSGKSSLVRAGLLQRLQLNAIPGSSKWLVLDISLSQPRDPATIPAGQPTPAKEGPPLRTVAKELFDKTPGGLDYQDYFALEGSLTADAKSVWEQVLSKLPSGAHVILLIDQFEELFTLVDKEKHRAALLQFLHEASSVERIHVIVTVRADFYPWFLEPGISSFVAGHETFWLKPPDEHAMVAAMYWPAAARGYRFEDADLFIEILRDAGTSAGALPLLSYALEQLAEKAESIANGFMMTRLAYRRIGRGGGVKGVIKGQVEEALEAMQPPLKGRALEDAVGNLFRTLVTVDENGVPTKKPANFDKADRSWTADAIRLKEVLVEKRLLITSSDKGGSTLEIAHEALLQNWDKLIAWVDRSKSALLQKKSVERAAHDWLAARSIATTELSRVEIDRKMLWPQERMTEVEEQIRAFGDLTVEVRQFLGPEFDRIRKELWQPIDYRRRAEISERLAQLGDRRRGVGLRNDLPDILWCHVPEGIVTLAGVEPDMATRKVSSFYISRYTVTLEQFNVFTKPDNYFQPEWWAGLPIQPDQHRPYASQRQVHNHPAQFVSWYQAMAFCNWLSAQLGYAVRLPTEWEWVQAATGGHADHIYPWGTEWDKTKANHCPEAYHLMAVGMYPEGRSPVGAFDMVGNMYQWCLNEFDPPYAIEPSSNPRTTRGGAFFLMPPEVKVEEQLSIRHRLKDLADGTGDRGRRVAVCIRLVTEQPGTGATKVGPHDEEPAD
jgi:hypothetical protein